MVMKRVKVGDEVFNIDVPDRMSPEAQHAFITKYLDDPTKDVNTKTLMPSAGVAGHMALQAQPIVGAAFPNDPATEAYKKEHPTAAALYGGLASAPAYGAAALAAPEAAAALGAGKVIKYLSPFFAGGTVAAGDIEARNFTGQQERPSPLSYVSQVGLNALAPMIGRKVPGVLSPNRAWAQGEQQSALDALLAKAKKDVGKPTGEINIPDVDPWDKSITHSDGPLGIGNWSTPPSKVQSKVFEGMAPANTNAPAYLNGRVPANQNVPLPRQEPRFGDYQPGSDIGLRNGVDGPPVLGAGVPEPVAPSVPKPYADPQAAFATAKSAVSNSDIMTGAILSYLSGHPLLGAAVMGAKNYGVPQLAKLGAHVKNAAIDNPVVQSFMGNSAFSNPGVLNATAQGFPQGAFQSAPPAFKGGLLDGDNSIISSYGVPQ